MNKVLGKKKHGPFGQLGNLIEVKCLPPHLQKSTMPMKYVKYFKF